MHGGEAVLKAIWIKLIWTLDNIIQFHDGTYKVILIEDKQNKLFDPSFETLMSYTSIK